MKQASNNDPAYRAFRDAATHPVHATHSLEAQKRRLKDNSIEYTRKGLYLYIKPEDADKAHQAMQTDRRRRGWNTTRTQQ